MKRNIYWGMTLGGLGLIILAGIQATQAKSNLTLTEAQRNQRLLNTGLMANTGFMLLAVGAAFIVLTSKKLA